MTNTNTAEQTFLYSVHPRTVIKELPVAPIRVPKSLFLTKEQVLICLKHGAVYRRFANEGKNEKVTIANVDRMHNEKFMTEEQYAAFLKSAVVDNRGTTIADIPATSDDVEKQEEETVEPMNEDEVVESENLAQNTEEFSEKETVENTEEEDECAACNIDYSSLNETVESEETIEESAEQEAVVEETSAATSEESVKVEENKNQSWNNGKNKNNKPHR